MASVDPITSADAFAINLADVCNRYMLHLEPTAERQDYAVDMQVTGEQLNITFHKKPGKRPHIAFTLAAQDESDDEPGPASRRWR